ARLEIHGLSLSRGERVVLDGFSLSVGEGEIFGLLGPNGAGKSSAFAALVGLLPAESGEVRLDGEAMGVGDVRLRARMGVVFQDPALDDRLTARDNLALAAALNGLRGADARDRVAEMVVFAELDGRDREPVKQLSGGMRRRLELARALIHRPGFLLMDEPTTGLDEPSFRRVWRAYRALAAEHGVSILLTTHRAEEAELCDRLAFLDGGRIVAEGTPVELRRQVGGEVIEFVAGEPELSARGVSEALGLEATVHGGKVRVVTEGGAGMIPRIADLFPEGRLESIELHRPGLADVFLALTGHDLSGEVAS
ncbi:MAG: ABC transporter ATP-binding protein, partial [Planctomycetota bacterium]